jgi:ketosteroid isomerase-like protein
MNRKISVFILLILLASSFKYRAKTAEFSASTARRSSTANVPDSSSATAKGSFDDFMVSLHKANQELAGGNAEPFKALWSKKQDITAIGQRNEIRAKGWEAIEVKLNSDQHALESASEYAYENINTQVGTDLAYLLQMEHYRRKGEKPVDLRVTLLCRLEKDGWKIVHRHADDLKLK